MFNICTLNSRNMTVEKKTKVVRILELLNSVIRFNFIIQLLFPL